MNYGFKQDAKYCVANLGGCGGTMFTRFLEDKVGKDNVFGVHARDFVEFDGKVIFLFGNPFYAVMSMHRRVPEYRLEKHYKHFGQEPIFDWTTRDSLNMEGLFDDWYRFHNFDMISVRYETMWDNLGVIGEFLELDMSDFPAQVKRTTPYFFKRSQFKKDIRSTYKKLSVKIYSAKDVKIWKKV